MYVGTARRCMSGCGTRLGYDGTDVAAALQPIATTTAQWDAGNASGVAPSGVSAAMRFVDSGLKTYGAVKNASGGKNGKAPAPAGGFQNWLESQSNTTLAIGGIAALGLLLAVTR